MFVDIQSLIYSTLTSNLNIPVYDNVLEGTPFPYVTIGEDIGSDFSTKESLGSDIVVRINVWSAYPGMKEAKEIIDQIIDILVSSLNSFAARPLVDNVRFLIEEDGIRHGVLEMRFKLFAEV